MDDVPPAVPTKQDVSRYNRIANVLLAVGVVASLVMTFVAFKTGHRRMFGIAPHLPAFFGLIGSGIVRSWPRRSQRSTQILIALVVVALALILVGSYVFDG